LLSVVLAVLASINLGAGQSDFRPEIPKVWDDKAVEGIDLPLAQRDRSPRYMTSAEYYALKVRPIYKTYPAYAKGQEPAGYLESLKQIEPEIIFDPAKLHTKQDWIEAGKLVFESETHFFPAREQPSASEVAPFPLGKQGELPGFLPGFRYYIRKKGELEGGINSCAGCHTRLMPDGSLLEGAQGQPPFASAADLEALRKISPEAFQQRVDRSWALYGAPWVRSKEAYEAALTKEEYIRELQAEHPGVFPRQGTSFSHPVRIPSLIGIEDRKYLDATGLVRQRSMGDLMRYAAINEGLDVLAHYGDFQPGPGVMRFGGGDEGTRYSDEQLYALALYVYSLKPPPNPNPFDARARRGQQIFAEQGCAVCHTPPLYTNNMLNPVRGFKVPEDLRKSDAVMNTTVGTDPTLALETRRGTGFYKVPSLRGVWFRNGFGHGGQAETLEEWFDPARLQDGYVPKGAHLGPGPIEGHENGLALSPEDREALIAFLKTL
jgi:mono/diheme cytochrome c family protein